MSANRLVGIHLHPTREEAIDVAEQFVRGMAEHGISCVSYSPSAQRLRDRLVEIDIEPLSLEDLPRLELMVVFGGDGTILRASALTVPAEIPVLGVNLGHVGFLAELESYDVDKLVTLVAERKYSVESRLTLEATITDAEGRIEWESIAVNEVSVEKAAREKNLDVLVELDEQPVSRWSCDGMIVSTPTGSTAYAFSLGGPVMWPDVEAFLVVPMAAHALFARPMVLDPTSRVDIELVGGGANVWCDGQRCVEVAPGSKIHVVRGGHDLQFARIRQQPFTSRLVKKFDLNIDGFRATGTSRC